MGEYAFRKSDRTKIKIGTCETMYYLRYDDRDKVLPQQNSLNPAREMNLFWRLPFPDEDQVAIGEYDSYNRGLRLYKKEVDRLGRDYYTDFSDPKTANDPGNIQLKHESGLLINVPCHHGEKLPDLGDSKAFWNGKSHSLELAHLKNMANGVWPIVKCRHCGHMWRYHWSDIMEYIPIDMRKRLEVYAVGTPTEPSTEYEEV